MRIDQTRYDAFWRNPEKYRLAYELDIVPRATPYGLERGTAFHLIAEGRAKGASDEEIEQLMKDAGIKEKTRAVSWAMYNEYERKYIGSDIEVIAAEMEFIAPILGSPHEMVGRIDQIIRRGEHLWVGELKTANAKAQYDRMVEDWRGKPQADFVILGARALGHDPVGVFVRAITETAPPKVWEIEVRRSEHQLNLMSYQVHVTCETIEMYRRTFGIDAPWPHVPLSYPCSMSGRCEYEGVCGLASVQMTEEMLAGYKQREEHLDLMKDKEEEPVAA